MLAYSQGTAKVTLESYCSKNVKPRREQKCFVNPKFGFQIPSIHFLKIIPSQFLDTQGVSNTFMGFKEKYQKDQCNLFFCEEIPNESMRINWQESPCPLLTQGQTHGLLGSEFPFAIRDNVYPDGHLARP